ncbi:MAG: helix-turn-helix domain-containing protein [Clostridium sp.]|nr:helix-turn-helix domain-containing protein [Clostridium sp.]
MTDYPEIGQIIRDRRKQLNINQPTLAALSGIGLNTLVAIERGSGNPKIQTLIAVLDTLGLSVNITLKD